MSMDKEMFLKIRQQPSVEIGKPFTLFQRHSMFMWANDTEYRMASNELSYDIKKGEVVQPKVIHNDPADYGLTKQDAIRMHLRYLLAKKKDLESQVANTKSLLLRYTNWHCQWQLNEAQTALDKINKTRRMLLDQLKQQEKGIDVAHKKYVQPQYDLEAIKKVPCNLITDIAPTGFFIVNPFRNERSPSNSLHWNKATNRWTDYGSGQHGDNLDLYMKINDCDLPTALKNLSYM